MDPILTPEEMAAVDAAAPEPVEILIGRAGFATARAALSMLGGGYGRRVVVLAGPGNNGADGRDAARRLASRGARVEIVEALGSPSELPRADLVIDAAFGTGLTRAYDCPAVGSARVLAVDVPSGLDGLTGETLGRVQPADRTVTFAALKPGQLLGRGPELCGDLELVDIGLDVSGHSMGRVEASDVGAWLPPRTHSAHKWSAAVRVVAGSPRMGGAADLVSEAALRAGAGMVVTTCPGPEPLAMAREVVQRPLRPSELVAGVTEDLDRFGALVVGPGLGTSKEVLASVGELVSVAEVPLVLDADGLRLLEAEPDLGRKRTHPTVVTPHAGEFARITGAAPGSDRIAAVRELAGSWGCTVLLKGPATIVASPQGDVLVVDTGDQRLATAGTGDVLSGVIGAFLARGSEAHRAAAAAAFVHGRAGSRMRSEGGLAGDVLGRIGPVLSDLGSGAAG